MKNLTVIDAINDLINGINIAYSKNAANIYSMQEIRDIYNAIEFLSDTIETQQKQTAGVLATESKPAEVDTPTKPTVV